MKMKNIFVASGFALALGFSAMAGLGAKKEAVEVKAYADTYYLVGDFAADYSDYGDLPSWHNDNTSYPVKNNDTKMTLFHFKKWASNTQKGDEFKFCALNNWSDCLSFENLHGTAAGCFGNNSTNIYCNVEGDYAVYISDGNLYIDYPYYYYTGSDAEKGGSWGDGWTDKRLSIDGDVVEFSFAANEEFKLKRLGTWDGQINYNNLQSETGDNYYFRTFSKVVSEKDLSNPNIKCNYAATYDVSLSPTANHSSIKITIVPHGQVNHTVYLLDLNGDCLNVNHKAHVYNAAGLSSEKPGMNMAKVEGTNNIYKLECWNALTTVEFNNYEYDGGPGNENKAQSITSHINECFILTWDLDPEDDNHWCSDTWMSLEAAQFIDQKMKFETAHENAGDGSGLCKSAGWYSAAKLAFADLTADQKAEVNGFKRVADRLVAWAKANNETFTGSTFTSPAAVIGGFASEYNSSVFIIVIIAVSVIGACSIGIYAIRRKRTK